VLDPIGELKRAACRPPGSALAGALCGFNGPAGHAHAAKKAKPVVVDTPQFRSKAEDAE